MTSIIRSILNDHAMETDKTWTHDRDNTVGASEVGQCARKIFWLKSEKDSRYRVTRDEDYCETWGARVRGTIFEEAFWEPAMRRRFRKRLKFAGQEQQTFVSDYLSATPDALIEKLTPEEKELIGTEADEVMAECKTLDPRSNLTEAKSENLFQVQVQLGLVRELTPYKPTHSILSYTDASFWSDVKEYVVKFDPAIYATAKKRAMTIMTATSVDEVKPEGWIAGGRECNYCPFTIACGVERRNLPFADKKRPVDPQVAAEMREYAMALRADEKTRKELDYCVRALQDKIKTRLRETGFTKIPGVLEWTPVKGRSGYDNSAIKQLAVDAGLDVEQFKTTGEPTDRLTVTLEDEQLNPTENRKRK